MIMTKYTTSGMRSQDSNIVNFDKWSHITNCTLLAVPQQKAERIALLVSNKNKHSC